MRYEISEVIKKEQENRIEESDAGGGTRITTEQETEETTVYMESWYFCIRIKKNSL